MSPASPDPRPLFNASEYLLDRRLEAGDGDRVALVGDAGESTYAELHRDVVRTAAGLVEVGVLPEQRVLMIVADSPAFVVLFLAALRIGAIPVPVSTMLTAADIADLLVDSRCTAVAVSGAFAPAVDAAIDASPFLRAVVDLEGSGIAQRGTVRVITGAALAEIGDGGTPAPVYPTQADSPAFWLYTSGTTGKPKGAMHRHGAIREVCETYGTQVLGITRDDRCLSAAKAFFAFGLGNSVLFPLSVGASTVLVPVASKPDVIAESVRRHRPTLFFGGPTFFANMLRAELPAESLEGVRLIASAGEPLPAGLYRRFVEHFGVDILDGIGMTEMLHIFLSNREHEVRPGTTGVAVPGYDLELRDELGAVITGPDTPGTLFVRGASTATGYWSRYDASRQVFQGEWLRTGDTYVRDADGYYACLGRTGDMLKASGIWVSPADIEGQLLAHAAVAQAAVVAANDDDGLERPVAYVILAAGATTDEAELMAFCRDNLASFKRPRRVVVVDEFPTTATGKIRRVELRAMAEQILTVTAPARAGV
ncbi:benzoate-CoA ligase family protein [Jatrophihabitans endophyticus]|uniref:benzoate-CoA ligase family protein n=1 Tax=Jatrophihabitans endophyticus TaxID=1206085 RepID=UPI0026EC6203|nr:benzoate-CoA ligase family protein [Jatrophihabitans endophyticus]